MCAFLFEDVYVVSAGSNAMRVLLIESQCITVTESRGERGRERERERDSAGGLMMQHLQ